jgi:hypothetical protein
LFTGMEGNVIYHSVFHLYLEETFDLPEVRVFKRMSASAMLHRVDLVTKDVSKEHIASIIRVTRKGELGTLAVTSNYSTIYYYINCSQRASVASCS